MATKPLRYLLLTLLLWCKQSVWAVTGGLGMNTATLSADTLHFGDTLRISTHIVNYSSGTYQDSISFGLKINGITNVNHVLFPNPFLGQTVTIPAGDSIPASLIVIITPAYCQVGPDILVIWPIAADATPDHERLTEHIFVIIPTTDTTDVPEEKDEKNLKLFSNGDYVHIINNSVDIQLNRVIIWNLEGQKIAEQPIDNNTSVPFGPAPTGLYVAEIIYDKDKHLMIKFIK